MTEITLRGTTVHTSAALPAVGETAPAATLVDTSLAEVSTASFAGKRVIYNIFPSIDTGICAASVRHFNQEAAALENTVVVCVSRDLPFALARFCGAEGIENVITLSDFRRGFGAAYGVDMIDGGLSELLSRAIVVVDENGTVIYTEQVPEIGQEPDYAAALAALQ
ncbi:thiol peroxidase [Leucobacter sp. OH2974_COT-288]|uniref:Thiol peroxidase n=1 Tax=Canibacter oris TaxID=1365628 RepID=A0A840DJY7_9MICO|nr:thiol peroxidase [Canibacter oris]MBB4072003.1 thiol peroxidase [Canibacter oris]RRD35217.1 thiol peroxidase [Leucobacter sp. OH2974_COT-288]